VRSDFVKNFDTPSQAIFTAAENHYSGRSCPPYDPPELEGSCCRSWRRERSKEAGTARLSNPFGVMDTAALPSIISNLLFWPPRELKAAQNKAHYRKPNPYRAD
jgi:hypothetical protein